MEIKVTQNMFPDLLATAVLLTLSIYHLMIYWGRRKDREEVYNLYFAVFVFSIALSIISLYFQPQYFVYAYKPAFMNVINIEMLSICLLFFGGIKFLNLLLQVPANLKKYFYFNLFTLAINFFLTLTSNFISKEYYYAHILIIVLLVVFINVLVVYFVYGYWIYKEKLYRDSFVRILYFGFLLLTANMLYYRTIELLNIPKILILNHYISAFILYIFAYALSVKFNNEYLELKELKISLEKKVIERTDDLQKSNKLLEQTNIEIEKQKQEIITINQQLATRAEELKELDEVKSRFFTNISHEFRTPLTLIIGPLESFLSKTSDEKSKTEFHLMLRQANRLLVLINQLLELSKLQKGMMKLKVSFDDINRFLSTLVSSYSSFAFELEIELTFIQEIKNQMIWFDKDKVEKIITNLITNAFKFTKKGGKIQVYLRLSSDQKFIEVSVKDSGIGLEPEHLKHIFDPFYQADSILNNRFEGTGIGLSLVKELTDLHHGKVSVNSVFDKGSEFTIKLPIDKSLFNENELLEGSDKYQLKKDNIFIDTIETVKNEVNEFKNLKTTILLVEDNADMRYYICTSLREEYFVIEASNGKEGLEMARELNPDLIIADVMMPLMNGLELTRNIKNESDISHIPVIILTAKASEASKIEGLDTRADDYITKPFKMEELLLRIRNLIFNRQKLREKFSKSLIVNPSEVVTTSIDEKFLKRALELVENNLDNPDYSAEKFSEDMTMSRTHLHRKLKALTDQSATEFIRTIRLKRAGQLLKQKVGSVSEIAFQTGFNNLSYFTKCFKEQFGVVPTEYFNLS